MAATKAWSLNVGVLLVGVVGFAEEASFISLSSWIARVLLYGSIVLPFFVSRQLFAVGSKQAQLLSDRLGIC